MKMNLYVGESHDIMGMIKNDQNKYYCGKSGGDVPGTPKNVSWNPPRCPEWSVFEGGGVPQKM